MTRWPSIEELIAGSLSLDAGDRKLSMVILHHTWRPDHASWGGHSTAEAVKRFWLRRQMSEGWTQPPGGHFIVAPDGIVYQPFALSVPLNANSDRKANRTGVAIEVVGNFDVGKDVMTEPQEHAAYGLIGLLLHRFRMGSDRVFFHRSFPAAHKSCPGDSLDLVQVRGRAALAKKWVSGA